MGVLSSENATGFNKTISSMEYSHRFYASSMYNNNYEIVIPINQQDVIMTTIESMLHIKGTLSGINTGGGGARIISQQFCSCPVMRLDTIRLD